MNKSAFEFLKHLRLLPGAIVILFVLSACGRKPYDSIDFYINQYIKENNIPGFACCIVKDDQMHWYNAYAKANVGEDKTMSIDGIMNIASISKTFTATAAMQLWEREQIKLDADASEYLGFKVRNPNYPDTPITVYQILTHTSSILDGSYYGESYACGDPAISLKYWIHNYLIPEGEYYMEDENFGEWEPGTQSAYSNVAFGLLGLIVEEVARQPFNEYCKEFIFEPLGMHNTGWFLSEIETDHHIKSYVYVSEEDRNEIVNNKKLLPDETEFISGSNIVTCLYSFPNYPDGLVRTSIRELSYFLISIMNEGIYNGSRILKKSTIEKMLTLKITTMATLLMLLRRYTRLQWKPTNKPLIRIQVTCPVMGLS
jgi:CubicO group peptidase (beta-lactamase class C family)